MPHPCPDRAFKIPTQVMEKLSDGSLENQVLPSPATTARAPLSAAGSDGDDSGFMFRPHIDGGRSADYRAQSRAFDKASSVCGFRSIVIKTLSHALAMNGNLHLVCTRRVEYAYSHTLYAGNHIFIFHIFMCKTGEIVCATWPTHLLNSLIYPFPFRWMLYLT